MMKKKDGLNDGEPKDLIIIIRKTNNNDDNDDDNDLLLLLFLFQNCDGCVVVISESQCDTMC